MKNGDQSAFAAMNEVFKQRGLTKREYFAAMAMQGLLSNSAIGTDPIGTARTAATYADALLKELGE